MDPNQSRQGRRDSGEAANDRTNSSRSSPASQSSTGSSNLRPSPPVQSAQMQYAQTQCARAHATQRQYDQLVPGPSQPVQKESAHLGPVRLHIAELPPTRQERVQRRPIRGPPAELGFGHIQAADQPDDTQPGSWTAPWIGNAFGRFPESSGPLARWTVEGVRDPRDVQPLRLSSTYQLRNGNAPYDRGAQPMAGAEGAQQGMMGPHNDQTQARSPPPPYELSQWGCGRSVSPDRGQEEEYEWERSDGRRRAQPQIVRPPSRLRRCDEDSDARGANAAAANLPQGSGPANSTPQPGPSTGQSMARHLADPGVADSRRSPGAVPQASTTPAGPSTHRPAGNTARQLPAACWQSAEQAGEICERIDCNECDYAADHRLALIDHMTQVHDHRFHCQFLRCDRSFRSTQGLDAHQRRTHGMKQKLHCDECRWATVRGFQFWRDHKNFKHSHRIGL